MNQTRALHAAAAGGHEERPRGLSWRELLLVAVPPALLVPCFLWFFWRVRLPFWDQFTMSLIFDAYYSSQLSFAHFWEPFNGHRVPLQRMISLGLGVLTRWNVAIEALIPNLLNLGIFVIILRQLKRAVRRSGGEISLPVLLFLSALFFSLNQYENWFNGWNIQIPLTEIFMIGALLLLCRDELSWPQVAGAIAFAIASSFSFGAGVATWPVGCVAILMSRSPRRFVALAVWTVAAAVTGFLYLHGSVAEGARSFPNIARLPTYFTGYLGAPIFSIHGEKAAGLAPMVKAVLGFVAPVVGMLGVAGAGFSYLVGRRSGLEPLLLRFPAMLCLFALATGGLTAIARTHFGQSQAMSPHYISVSRYLWMGAAMLYCIARPQLAPRIPRLWRSATAAAIGLMMLASYANGARHLRNWRREQLEVQAQLWSRYDDTTLRRACPVFSFAQLHQGVEAMKRNKLALYAGISIGPEVGVYIPSASSAEE